MKQSCTSCHFLAKDIIDANGKTMTVPWNDEDRRAAMVGEEYTAKCYQRVWDESMDGSLVELRTELISMSRRHACFYYPKTPYMMFSAANELQNRTQQAERLQGSNRATQIALWVLSLAVIANTAIEFLVALA